MGRWLQTCRTCGMTAPDLAALPVSLQPGIDTKGFHALDGNTPRHAFLRWAVLAEVIDEWDEAANAVLQAAWLCDDEGDEAAAADLRRRAARLWGHGDTVGNALRVLDALRRTGDMDAARAQAEHTAARPGLEDTDRAVLRYQERLIEAGDTGRHLLSSALRPPARTPHVTHGRPATPPPAAPSLWQRLFKR